MAVTRVELIDQTGDEALTGGRRVRTYQSVYKVKSNTLFENPSTVRNASPIPALASGWPDDPGAFLVSKKVARAEAPDAWIVTCDFTSNPDIRHPDDVEEDPLLRPAVVDRSPVQRARIITRDTEDTLVVNSAGEYFNPPLEREEHPPAFSITKNMTAWPAAVEIAFTDSINDSVISIPSKGIAYGVGMGKFNGFSGRQVFENNTSFWQVTGEFEQDWQGWNKPVPDAGYSEIYLGERFTILEKGGDRPAMPVLLDGSGVADPFRDPPFLLTFKKYRELNHATLFALFGL